MRRTTPSTCGKRTGVPEKESDVTKAARGQNTNGSTANQVTSLRDNVTSLRDDVLSFR